MSANSRFLRTRQFTDRNGNNVYAEWRPIPIRATVSTEYIVTSGDVNRPDWIAYKTLGSSDLWWAILQFNGLPDGMGLVAGDRIAIPPVSVVKAAVLKAANETVIDYPSDMQTGTPLPVKNYPISRVPRLTDFLRTSEASTTTSADTAFNLGFEIPDVSDVLHFQLQLSTNSGFTAIAFSAFTLQSVAQWFYYNPSFGAAGGFEQFPASGVNAAYYNGNTCYYGFLPTDLVSEAQYYPRWRYFNSAGTESAWFSTTPFFAP
jgi:hypothetical protein